MALPATDTFTGTNADPLSANWTTLAGGFQIYANAANETGSAQPNFAYWDADVFGNDQYVQANITGAQGCVGVRLAATRGYCVRVNSGLTELEVLRIDAGTATSLQNFTGLTVAVGALIRLEISGTTLTVKNDGATVGTTSDATYSSGSAGIAVFGSAGSLIDNFEGGDLAGGSSAFPAHYYQQMRK